MTAAKLAKALEQIQEVDGVNLIAMIEEIIKSKKQQQA
jgi:hypothetical protein